MRSLALAGTVFLLAGCSLNYEGTSFKALPQIENKTVVEHSEGGEESTKAEGQDPGTGTSEANPNDVALPKTTMSRAGAVFPDTAQPGR